MHCGKEMRTHVYTNVAPKNSYIPQYNLANRITIPNQKKKKNIEIVHAIKQLTFSIPLSTDRLWYKRISESQVIITHRHLPKDLCPLMVLKGPHQTFPL